MAQAILKIKPIIVNRLGHLRGDQMVNGQTGFHSSANLRGGNAQRKTREGPPAEWGGERTFRLPRPWYDYEFQQPRQFAGLPPLGQQRHMIRADQIKKLRVGKTAEVIPHGFYGVGDSTAPGFLLSGLKGDCAAGTKKSRVKASSSRAAWATNKWPRWTGSNEPPNKPSFIFNNTA